MNKYRALYIFIFLFFLTIFSQAFARASATDYDSLMRAYGMVDIHTLDTSILVDLKYSTTDNFVGVDIYGTLKKAYFEKNFVKRIVKAQHLIQAKDPGYRLLVYDAARPLSVQRKMYQLVENTPHKVYVANGKRGGRHNYGVAVDITICNAKGEVLDMGTDFDHFGMEAHIGDEAVLIKKGVISTQAMKNRKLLRSVMHAVGLKPYRREWWHYEEPITIAEVRKRYRLLDF
nr:M15 family metallopeptidase [Porphyromonas pogonae]